MILLASVLFGALFTVAVALAGGTLVLRALGLRLYREEERFFAFVVGAACLSLTVFVLCAMHQARPWVFLILGVAVLGLACRRGAHRAPGEQLPALGRWTRVAFWLLYTAFAVFYLATALAPESSPDGSGYHLGAVSRYLAHGGFFFTTNMYASLSHGLEMPFLFAFAFGRHSAAALVHSAFYLALPLGMLAFGKRFRFPGAAATGGLLVFLSPIVGFDGSAAYNDVALACVLFAVFYLLQIWDRERTRALLVAIGLLAGFAYAVKYTGFLAFPYAAGFVAWKLLRKRTNPLPSLALLSGCSFLLIAPWLIKNWLIIGNPLAPFFNSWFPNRYFHIGSEMQYRYWMATWGDLASRWEIPLEVTVGGSRLQGLLGPAFLLAPIALIAVRRPAGRQLLLAAAVFSATYPANIGTRFLIPMLPFLSLAMGLALADWRWATPLVVAFHAYTAWPVNLKQYCHPGAMRIEEFPYKAALRIETEGSYLTRKLPGYQVARLLDETVPQNARILCVGPAPESYTSREQLVSYQGALEENLADMLRAVAMPDWHPTKRYSFRFAERGVRRIRLVQEGTASNRDEFWAVNELRVRNRGREVARSERWRLTSDPNRWEVPLAFDNNPMTRWMTWEPIAPGMYIEVDFGGTEQVDEVTLDSIADQGGLEFRLEGWLSDGRRVALSGAAESQDIPAPESMRRWVSSEIRWNGIEYVLIHDSDFVAPDVRAHTAEYGFTQLFEKSGARLYRIDLGN
jgi:hypothetical protein